MSPEEIGKMSYGSNRSLNDETAVSIGELGENIQLRRAVTLRSGTSVLLAGYTHPATSEDVIGKEVVQFGKFGAVVAYRFTDNEGKGINQGRRTEIGRQLCQHIVGECTLRSHQCLYDCLNAVS